MKLFLEIINAPNKDSTYNVIDGNAEIDANIFDTYNDSTFADSFKNEFDFWFDEKE